jgi:hypothetical protein
MEIQSNSPSKQNGMLSLASILFLLFVVLFSLMLYLTRPRPLICMAGGCIRSHLLEAVENGDSLMTTFWWFRGERDGEALMTAALAGNLKIVRLLVNLGADVPTSGTLTTGDQFSASIFGPDLISLCEKKRACSDKPTSFSPTETACLTYWKENKTLDQRVDEEGHKNVADFLRSVIKAKLNCQ